MTTTHRRAPLRALIVSMIAGVALSASLAMPDNGFAEYGSDPRYIQEQTITDVFLSGTRRASLWIEYNGAVRRLAGKLDVTWGTVDVARVFVQRIPFGGCGARPCEWATIADFTQTNWPEFGAILSTSAVTVSPDYYYRACSVVRDSGTQVTVCTPEF